LEFGSLKLLDDPELGHRMLAKGILPEPNDVVNMYSMGENTKVYTAFQPKHTGIELTL
jgi:hypothetical protein